jgi:large subunit ribosomal protein L27
MAHTKQQGAANRHIKRPGRRLGVKLFGGEVVKSGSIIIRQKGTKYHPGLNVYMGKDFTISSKMAGKVAFRDMSGPHRGQKYVDVVPAE